MAPGLARAASAAKYWDGTMKRDDSSIKFKPLEDNIPKGGELYDYLAQKEETGIRPAVRAPQRLAQAGTPRFETFPKTLLLMPPITLSEGTVKRVIPPLGLAYIGGVLKQHDVPFEILDCVAEGLDREQYISDKTWMYGLDDDAIGARLEEIDADVVGISIIYSSDLHSLFRLARLAKQVKPDVVVVVGGIHCTIYPREVLTESAELWDDSIDYVIRGEGEYRLLEFLNNLAAGNIDLNADGLCGYHDGGMFINPQIEVIEDLDALPLPAYDKLPMESYFDFNVPFSPFPRGKRVMQIYTSRGCPIGCTFCASTNFNKRYRHRSPDNVMAEIEHYRATYGIDEIQFADDNLTFNRSRALELFTKLKDRGLQWCTPNGIMVDTLTKPMLDLMIGSGLYQITLSIDSGSAKVLKSDHRKPVDLSKVPDLAAYLKERNILIHATLVVGMPGETVADIDDGFRFVTGLPLNSIGVFIAQALPGSELYEKAIFSGQISKADGRIIDTAQGSHMISSIERDVLEKKISDFLYSYNMRIRERDPIPWELKYRAHKDRLATITIGNAAPNTDGITRAAQPAPAEILNLPV